MSDVINYCGKFTHIIAMSPPLPGNVVVVLRDKALHNEHILVASSEYLAKLTKMEQDAVFKDILAKNKVELTVKEYKERIDVQIGFN